MGASKVPEDVLQRIEKLSPEFSAAAQDLRAASEERSIRAAEKALSTQFLLTPGAAFKANLTRAEEQAVTTMVYGRGYEEPER